jgi:glycerol kinase
VFDGTGRVCGYHYLEHHQILPRPGWVEHDPLEIWANTVAAVRGALGGAGIGSTQLAAVGIANQRETTLVWNRRTGQPYTHAVVWQCTRSEGICKRLISEGVEALVTQRTGLVIATYFSGPKLAWLLAHVPGLREDAERGDALFGTVDSWLIWNLTGGTDGGRHVTDVTNASRTMLMDLERLEWDEELLELLGVPRAMLPEICASSTPSAFGRCCLPELHGVPVGGVLGDQQAALVGQCCFAPGEAKNTYGTGSFLLMQTGQLPVRSAHGLVTTVAYRLGEAPPAYALEGSIAITGAAVQWLRDNVGIISCAAESETVAGTVSDTGGVYFVPAFSGLYAPHWDMTARGAIVGLTRYTGRAHLVRATLEAICYQAREVLEAMEADAGIRLKALKVDGGAVANDLLMQLQADVLGTPVVRPRVTETTALGAAYAAGLAAGVWGGLDDLRAQWGVDREFLPVWDDAQRGQGYRGWQRAVERARHWTEE